MTRIELVIHCWQFSRALQYLLESLFRHPPQTETHVMATVCYSDEDDRTRTLLFQADTRMNRTPEGLYIQPWPMLLGELLNRSIGRNERALGTDADLVWFMDCDYWLGEGCLDSLADVAVDPRESDYSPLYYPQTVLISKDHATGDAYTDRIAWGGPVEIDPTDFIPKREKKAIGGIQIVPGDVARVVGYAAAHPRYLKPVTNGKWQTTHGDVVLRKVLGTNGKPIDMPNCYRIRQSVEGVCDARG